MAGNEEGRVKNEETKLGARRGAGRGKANEEGRMMMKIDLNRETIRLVRDKIGRWQGFLRCCQGTRPDCLANIVVGMRQRSVWAFPPHPGA